MADHAFGTQSPAARGAAAPFECDRLFENTLSPMYVGSFDGRITRCNHALELLNGYDRAELLAQPVANFVHPDDRPAVAAEIQKLAAGGSAQAFPCRMLHKDGSLRWTLWNATAFPDCQAYYATGQDVTERHNVEQALAERARLATLTAEAGLALTREPTLAGMLRKCAEALVRHVDAAFARIWVFNEAEQMLELRASAGLYTHLDGKHSRIPLGQFKIGLIAQSRQPQLTNSVIGDPRVQDQAWAQREGMVSFAGYPLLVEDQLIGVAALFGRQPLSEAALTALAAVADSIAVGIQQRLAEESLRASEETLRVISESALDAVILLDNNGNVAHWNAAAARIFGYAREEVLGRNLHAILVPYEFRERYRLGLPRFAQTGEGPVIGKTQELEALHKDGSRFPVEVSVAAVSRHGQWNAVGVVRDITQRKRSEAELIEAKQAAESANRSKSEFLANMSHEVRTPMNGIIGLTSLVLDTDLNKEQRQYLDGVMLSAEALLKIINDILDFSKIEAGRLELEKLAFDLRETLGNTIQTLALRAHEKGLELLCDIRPEVPDALVGDPVRLWQVLVNLVGNAIKFTHQGEVSVVVAVESLEENAVCLRFTVSDTGIGIPADKQQVLFKPFSQADSSMARKYGGTGLGLAISAQIVQLMKGRIWFESELGKGSRFQFTAWFDRRTTPLPKRAPLPPSALDGLRVLVVDDNATNRRILNEVLTHWGMRPAEVDGGEAALVSLQAAFKAGDAFGLILLDVMMPVMDGFAVLQRIRQMPEIDRPVILMLSSSDQPGNAARARELGAAAYIIKPIRPSELLDAIMKALNIAFEPSPPPAAPTPKRAAAPRGPSLRILVAEDNPVNQLLAVRILEKAGHRVAAANNGEEVLTAIGREAFDLVLMDVQMPVIDGFEATALIRQQEKGTGRHLPLIAMTAHAMKGDKEKCLEAGMDGYVSKPIRSDELFATIEAAVPSAARHAAATSN